MKNIETALNLTRSFDKARDELNEFFAPHLEAWKEILVQDGTLSRQEADRDFHYQEVVDGKVVFHSDMWEEHWAYGGYELHYGEAIYLPLEFIENPEKYVEASRIRLQEKEAQEQKKLQQHRKNKLAHAERELEKARLELEESK